LTKVKDETDPKEVEEKIVVLFHKKKGKESLAL
jgi:hypothetical protein